MTPYSDIYDLYFGMCSDYEFLTLPPENQDNILEGWLLSSIGEFANCKTDLSDRDSISKKFNVDLKDNEKLILAKYILTNWLSPKLYTVENLKNYLSSKDFNMYSPANLLKEIRTTYKDAYKNAEKSKIQYEYKHFDPSKDLII